MPKVAIDYSNTIIYKIVCKDLNVKELYVGNTVNFRQRKTQHKKACVCESNKSQNLKIYKKLKKRQKSIKILIRFKKFIERKIN
jgi:predicted GIY-YIG superfamily endonuclease